MLRKAFAPASLPACNDLDNDLLRSVCKNSLKGDKRFTCCVMECPFQITDTGNVSQDWELAHTPWLEAEVTGTDHKHNKLAPPDTKTWWKSGQNKVVTGGHVAF